MTTQEIVGAIHADWNAIDVLANRVRRSNDIMRIIGSSMDSDGKSSADRSLGKSLLECVANNENALVELMKNVV